MGVAGMFAVAAALALLYCLVFGRRGRARKTGNDAKLN